MRVYLANQSIVEIEDSVRILKQMSPLEFQVYRNTYCNDWIVEQDIINKCRNNATNIFKRISDRKILEVLVSLTKQNFLTREEIETDLEEDFGSDVVNVETPMVIGKLSTKES